MPIIIRYFLVCFFCLFASSAWGKANIGVWPIKVFLFPKHAIGEVHLVNKGENEVKLQVYAKSWDIDETGKFVETDTGEFVFYPRLLAIPSGEEKVLRVGYNGDFPPYEKAYRLYIHELPKIGEPEKPEKGMTAGLNILLRLSLPLFVSPSDTPPTPQPEIEEVALTAEGIRLAVKNQGTHHFMVEKIEARIVDKEGETLSSGEKKTHILRILPQRRVFFDIPLSLEDCSLAKQVEIHLFLEDMKEPMVHSEPIEHGCTVDKGSAKN